MILNHKIYGKEHTEQPPIIILHGLFGMLDNWTSIAKKLSETHQVHTLDLRNHGRSFHAEEMNYSAMADDVLEYIDQAGFATISLIGHSMGGKVVLQIANKYPYIINKMIVADMSMRAYEVRHGAILSALNDLPLSGISNRNELEEELQKRLPADLSVIQFLLKSAYRNDYGGFALRFNVKAITEHIEALGKSIDFGSQKIDAPCLYIYGTKSDYVNQQDLADAKHVFTNFESVALDAGHWLHAEQPQAFTEKVQKFLGNKN
jgi:pimeloyl-ACP methyl ester carboxylesterase